jgi:hypothetical protein
MYIYGIVNNSMKAAYSTHLIISRHKFALFIILIEINNISGLQNLCHSLFLRLQSAHRINISTHSGSARSDTL